MRDKRIVHNYRHRPKLMQACDAYCTACMYIQAVITTDVLLFGTVPHCYHVIGCMHLKKSDLCDVLHHAYINCDAHHVEDARVLYNQNDSRGIIIIPLHAAVI